MDTGFVVVLVTLILIIDTLITTGKNQQFGGPIIYMDRKNLFEKKEKNQNNFYENNLS